MLLSGFDACTQLTISRDNAYSRRSTVRRKRVVVFANPPPSRLAVVLVAVDVPRISLADFSFERRPFDFVDGRAEKYRRHETPILLYIRETRALDRALPLVFLHPRFARRGRVSPTIRTAHEANIRPAAGRIIHRSDVDSYIYNARA